MVQIIGFIYGYFKENFGLTVNILLAGVGLATVVRRIFVLRACRQTCPHRMLVPQLCVPDWSWFNSHKLEWLPAGSHPAFNKKETPKGPSHAGPAMLLLHLIGDGCYSKRQHERERGPQG